MLRESKIATFHIDGGEFRAWRESRGMSLRWAAAELAVSPTYLGRIETTPGEFRVTADLAARFKQLMEGCDKCGG